MQQNRERQDATPARPQAAPHQYRQTDLEHQRSHSFERENARRLRRQAGEDQVDAHHRVGRQIAQITVQFAAIFENSEQDPLNLHQHADQPGLRATVAEAIGQRGAVTRVCGRRGPRRGALEQQTHPDETPHFFAHARHQRAIHHEGQRIGQKGGGRFVPMEHVVVQRALDHHREQREDGDAGDRVPGFQRERPTQTAVDQER
ncbi:hypothetical protein KCU90_g3413, partial [Aureobasidium melanogenum]